RGCRSHECGVCSAECRGSEGGRAPKPRHRSPRGGVLLVADRCPPSTGNERKPRACRGFQGVDAAAGASFWCRAATTLRQGARVIEDSRRCAWCPVSKSAADFQERLCWRLAILKNSERTDLLSKNCSLNRDVECRSVEMIFAHSFSERSAMAPRYTIGRKEAPNPTDQHASSRVRMRRLMLAMSQEKLGAALGLSFQQVQKYERGTNRIGASRLQQISHILQVPLEFFFEGAPNASAPHDSLSMAQIDDFVSDPDGLRLIEAFMRIDNPDLRLRIVMLVQEIAGDDD